MKTIEKIIKKFDTENISENEKIFCRQYFSYLRRERDNLNLDRVEEILDGFFNDEIQILKSTPINPAQNSPILICTVKNDLQRMKKFFSHYRSIGIEKFAIIDNNSDKATREFFLSQEDADIFLVTHKFSSARHVSWLNKILCHYGYNRWYLSADSDEFLDYIGSENFSIQDITAWAEKNFLRRILAVQIDFYAAKNLFQFEGDVLSWEELKYFDTDSYEIKSVPRYKLIVGGPRKRVLNTYSVLTKYPLFFLQPEDVNVSVHYLYPYEKNIKSPCLLVLKHYEFINQSDELKFRRIIQDENYASGSKEYKEMLAAMQNFKNVSFWYEQSAMYNSSEDLRKLSFISEMTDRK